MATTTTKKKTPAQQRAAALKKTTAKPRRRVVKKTESRGDASQVPGTAPSHAQAALSSVPPLHLAKSYVQRTHAGVTDFEMFDLAIANRMNVLIQGPTGTGKTHAFMAWLAARAKQFASVSSSIGLDHTQLIGKYIPAVKEGDESVEDTVKRLKNMSKGEFDKWADDLLVEMLGQTVQVGSQFFWQDGSVTHVVRNGGGLLLNEANFIPERIGTVLFSLLDRRREIQLMDHKGEVIRAHVPTITLEDGTVDTCWCDDPGGKDCESKWVIVVADMNPNYEGTRPLNKAFRNRFALQLTFDYDAKVDAQLVKSPALRKLFGQFRDAGKDGTYTTPFSTNMMVEWEKLTRLTNLDFAILNFLGHLEEYEQPIAKGVIANHRSNLEKDLLPPVQSDKSGPKVVRDVDEDEGVYGIDWVFDDEDPIDVQRRLGLTP